MGELPLYFGLHPGTVPVSIPISSSPAPYRVADPKLVNSFALYKWTDDGALFGPIPKTVALYSIIHLGNTGGTGKFRPRENQVKFDRAAILEELARPN